MTKVKTNILKITPEVDKLEFDELGTGTNREKDVNV